MRWSCKFGHNMMSINIKCFSCKKVTSWENVTRRDECPHCKADAHVCLNCRFFSESHHHQCLETQAEYVKEKERANFCEYFAPSSSSDQSGSKSEDLLKTAEQLFKK